VVAKVFQAWAQAEKENVHEDIEIGCSFSPEEMEMKIGSGQKSLDALKIIVEKFGIQEIRLGMRWGSDFEYYKPFLDYCFNSDVNLCLNIGPIKVFRWPEEHVPKNVLEKLSKIPEKEAQIEKDMEIAQEAYSHLDELLEYLQKNYSKRNLDKIRTIQIENECFNPFGQFKWTFGQAYLIGLMKKINRILPNAGFMLSSSACKDTKKISSVFKEFQKQNPKFTNDLAFGINYYYKTPFNQKWPLINKLDNIVQSNLFLNLCAWTRKEAKKQNYRIEISEAQAEGWGPNIQGPGKLSKEFQFMLIRCTKEILNLQDDEKSIIRIWGIENFAKDYLNGTLDKEQEQILRTVKTINNQ